MFLSYKSHLSVHHIIRNSHLHCCKVTVLHMIGLVLFTLRHLCLYQYEECIGILCLHCAAKSCVNAPDTTFNPLSTELNSIFHLLALLGAHHILHVSWLRPLTFSLTLNLRVKENVSQCVQTENQ
jgi:hypothetical protein